MGEMTLLITGAGGYLGRYAVAAARARGHKVRALIRGSAPENWQSDTGISVVKADLTTGPLSDALTGIDAVIHIAASLTGDDATHARDTFQATLNLYAEIAKHPVPVVLAGSMAVYQGRAGMVDEDTPLEPNPDQRDAYLRAKLAQEGIAKDAMAHGINTRILRLGAIYGPDRLWNSHIGVRAGPVLIRLAGPGELPITNASNAALALIKAAEKPMTSVEVLNIVDDDLPDACAYLAALPPHAKPRLTLPLPWQVLRPFAWLTRVLHLPAPGLLRPATLAARMAPRQFSNVRAKSVLGWRPSADFMS